MAIFQKREGIMLAYPAENKRIQAFPLVEMADGTKERKMFYQPKLNGERGRVDWFGNEPFIFSSYGNEFKFLDKIKKEVSAICAATNRVRKLDGEIYVHGWSRERIDSALRRTKNKNPEVDNLEFHVFDYQDTTDAQWLRIGTLNNLNEVVTKYGFEHIKIVEAGICTENTWLSHCAEYCERGYEGIILRNPFTVYEEKRSPGLLKFKPKETDIYTIMAVNEATTSGTNILKEMVGSFTVQAVDEPESAIFKVGAGKLTHDKRVEYFKRRDELVGMQLLVKHELLKTNGQVPIAAVTVDVIW